jgi:hypothetical protein
LDALGLERAAAAAAADLIVEPPRARRTDRSSITMSRSNALLA